MSGRQHHEPVYCRLIKTGCWGIDTMSNHMMCITRLRGRTVRIGITAVVMMAAYPGLSGCQKSLFMKKHARHQFQMHDAMRNRNVPLTEPDVFGAPQPALRARLSRAQ